MFISAVTTAPSWATQTPYKWCSLHKVRLQRHLFLRLSTGRKKKSLWLSLPNAFVFNTAPGSVIVCLIGEATFFPCFLCSGATFTLWVCLLLLPGQQPHSDHAPLPQEKEMHLHQKIFSFSKKSLGVFFTLLSVPLSHCHKQTTSFESSYWHKSTAQKTVKLNCSVKK